MSAKGSRVLTHLQHSTESKEQILKLSHACQVTTVSLCDSPLTYLCSDSDGDEEVKRVIVEGVLLKGVVDTGSDLTIMGKEAFKKVATVAKLKKRDFHPADKKAHSYDGKPISLDGWLQLDLMFGEYSMSTPVYVKMDADDPLLLSEGVCRQLRIVTYHPSVQERQRPEGTALPKTDEVSQSKTDEEDRAKVPTVRVKLLNSACLLPNQCTPVQVVVEGGSKGDLLANIRGEPALTHPN